MDIKKKRPKSLIEHWKELDRYQNDPIFKDIVSEYENLESKIEQDRKGSNSLCYKIQDLESQLKEEKQSREELIKSSFEAGWDACHKFWQAGSSLCGVGFTESLRIHLTKPNDDE